MQFEQFAHSGVMCLLMFMMFVVKSLWRIALPLKLILTSDTRGVLQKKTYILQRKPHRGACLARHGRVVWSMPNPNIQTLCRPDIQDSMQPFWPSNAESLPCDCFLLKQICIVLIRKHFGQANFRREFHWNSNKAIHHSILQYSTTGNYNISRGYRYQEQAMHNTLILDIIRYCL